MFGVDDYSGRNLPPNRLDANGWPAKQCTAFGIDRLQRDFKVPHSFIHGNANEWVRYALSGGWKVDGTPRIHDLLCLGPGAQGSNPTAGHIAIVLEIGANSRVGLGEVWVEQYDWVPFEYSQRAFKIGRGAQFIHVPASIKPPVPTPHPLPTEDDPMFALLDVANLGTHIMFENGLLVNISDSSSIASLLALKNCAGRATIDAGTLTALLATPINKP